MTDSESEKVGNGTTSAETNQPFADRPALREFVAARNIRPEDFHIIEALAAFPKNLIVMELHNMFNAYHGRSARELEALIRSARDDARKALFAAALEFCNAYDWATAWNLVRVLENGK